MRRLLLVMMLLLGVTFAWASTAITVDDTSGGVAIAEATSTYDTAIITVEEAPIRYEFDGTAPTATTGHPALEGATFIISGRDAIRAFRAIRSTATNAVITVTLL